MTSYVGFMIGGSGLLLVLVDNAPFSQNDKALSFSTVGCFFLCFGVIANLVLMLLCYKFTSHNRIVGYQKLLTHERYDPGHRQLTNFVAWEIAVDQLRDADSNNGKMLDWANDPVNVVGNIPSRELISKLQDFSGPRPEANRRTAARGLALLVGGPTRKGPSNSWHFPLYVSRIFAVLHVL